MERLVIWTGVKAGETVWTGIPGIYRTAPEGSGTYSFVEYTDCLWNVWYAFEREKTNEED